MRTILKAATVAIGLLSAAPAFASTPAVTTEICPVGGEKFKFTGLASVSTWGARADGKPYGSWDFPLPVPICPNGLVVYRPFTADEKARLATIIVSPDFKALAKEAPYYRAARLEEALTGKPDPVLLLQASWQADHRVEAKTRYLQEFIAAVDKTTTPGALSSLALRLRAANALRELGRFDQASALISSIPRTEYDVRVPAQLRDANDNVTNSDAIDEAESRRSWIGYVAKLESIIARKDASSEPAEFKPDRDD